MWRDIFLNNSEAVLEMLQRFNEDLSDLQKAIRKKQGQKLHSFFSRTRLIVAVAVYPVVLAIDVV